MLNRIIRNAMLVDGPGAPTRNTDIAIRGGLIAEIRAVGSIEVTTTNIIDAHSDLGTPGWVNIHTLFDGQVTWDPHLSLSGWNGVTTPAMGNCGVGFAPAKPVNHGWLIKLMEGVDGIPGAALAKGISWDWETFLEYLDTLEKQPRALDIASQIPHAAVLSYVMGERGVKNESATPTRKLPGKLICGVQLTDADKLAAE